MPQHLRSTFNDDIVVEEDSGSLNTSLSDENVTVQPKEPSEYDASKLEVQVSLNK